MEDIYKNVLEVINSLTALSTTTYEFKGDPSEAKADEIVDAVNNCENNFLKVKEEIVRMIHDVDSSNKAESIEIEAVQMDNGFLIKEQ